MKKQLFVLLIVFAGSSMQLATAVEVGPTIKLNTGENQDIGRYEVSSDSKYVVMIDKNTLAVLVNSVAGGSTRTLSQPSAKVNSFLISPDGSHVIYTSRQGNDSQRDLFSVPITGGPQKKLNEDLTSVWDFKISPDSKTVAYAAFQQTSNYELFSVPLTGGASTKLNQTLLGGERAFSDYKFTPDSDFVIFRANTGLESRNELFATPSSGGGTVVRLHIDGDDLLQALTTASIFDFEVAPYGNIVIFSARNSIGERNLFRTTVDAPNAIKLKNENFPSFPSLRFEITADSHYVIANAPSLSTGEILLAPIDGTELFKKINVAPEGSVVGGANGFSLSNDGKHVLYFSSYSTEGRNLAGRFLYTIEAGSTSRPLGGEFLGFTPDSESIVFASTEQNPPQNTRDIFTYSINSGTRTKVNSESTRLLNTIGFGKVKFAKDSSRIAYRSPLVDTGLSQLVSLSIYGEDEIIHRQTAFLGQVVNFEPEFSDDSRYIFYKYTGIRQTDLFAVRIRKEGREVSAIPSVYCILLDICGAELSNQ